MKKLIAILMCLAVLVLCLAGCGSKTQTGDNTNSNNNTNNSANNASSDAETVKTDAERILGVWNLPFDFGNMIKEELGEDLEGVDMSDIKMNMLFEFKADGTCQMSLDEESFEADYAKLIDRLKGAMRKVIENSIKDAGLVMTVEEFLNSQGVTMDELMSGSFAKEELVENFATEVEKYLIEDGKLYEWDQNGEINKDEYTKFEFKDDNTLIFTEIVGEGAEDNELVSMLPLTLTRK